MTARAQLDSLNGIYKELGELVADVRTIKHSQNNAVMKLDAIGALVVTVEELAKDRDDHEQRLKTLEQTDGRQEGARGIVTWFLQSPLVAWIAAAVLLAVAWLKKP